MPDLASLAACERLKRLLAALEPRLELEEDISFGFIGNVLVGGLDLRVIVSDVALPTEMAREAAPATPTSTAAKRCI